ncbi:MAG: hypothetical protein ACI9CZ_001157, partial [Flavobacterium sp.]
SGRLHIFDVKVIKVIFFTKVIFIVAHLILVQFRGL